MFCLFVFFLFPILYLLFCFCSHFIQSYFQLDHFRIDCPTLFLTICIFKCFYLTDLIFYIFIMRRCARLCFQFPNNNKFGNFHHNFIRNIKQTKSPQKMHEKKSNQIQWKWVTCLVLPAVVSQHYCYLFAYAFMRFGQRNAASKVSFQFILFSFITRCSVGYYLHRHFVA